MPEPMFDPILDIQQALEFVARHIKSVFAVMTGAWDGLAILAVLMAGAIWYGFHRRYEHLLSSKDTIIANKNSEIQNKDASIEALGHRRELLEDQLKDAIRTRDEQVVRLGALAEFKPEELKREIEILREQLDERKEREWPLPTPEQEKHLISLWGRNDTHEVGERLISITRNDLPDIVYLTDKLVILFREAGWELQHEPGRAYGIIQPGIHVRAPVKHQGADLIASALADIFGDDAVNRVNLDSPLPPVFDRSFSVQLAIGRKPTPQDQIAALKQQMISASMELDRRKWREVTPEQERLFGEAVARSNTAIYSISIKCHSQMDPEAVNYWKELIDLFRRHGSQSGGSFDSPYAEFDPPNLVLVVQDPQNLTGFAQRIDSLLRAAQIDFTVMSDGSQRNESGWCYLRVGKKSSN